MKLRQHPLPSIHLVNLRSLPNKTDKLLLLSQTNKDFSNSAAVFIGTWLNDAIPDSSGMHKGGGGVGGGCFECPEVIDLLTMPVFQGEGP